MNIVCTGDENLLKCDNREGSEVTFRVPISAQLRAVRAVLARQEGRSRKSFSTPINAVVNKSQEYAGFPVCREKT